MSAALCGQTPADIWPSEQLHQFLPGDGEVLTKGTTVRVSAAVTLYPSLTESVEYIGTIKVNGRRRRTNGPFYSALTAQTPGNSETLSETLSWFVHVKGPKTMTVRLHLSGIGESSNATFQFADISRNYSVKCNSKEFVLFRWLDHLCGRCSY
jgi:hypothetical protein